MGISIKLLEICNKVLPIKMELSQYTTLSRVADKVFVHGTKSVIHVFGIRINIIGLTGRSPFDSLE